jgi:uncharacterized sulfatase
MRTVKGQRIAALAMLAGLMTGVSVAADTPARPLNVLLILADDLRDHLGCYGHPLVKTPNIDRLAARGVRFERAYVQYPVCNPSRSSLLSGLRPDQTHVVDNATLLRSSLPNVVTLPQWFKQHGYYTAAFGKVFHLGGVHDVELRATWMDLPFSWHEARSFAPTPAGQVAEVHNLTNGRLDWCYWGTAAGGDNDQSDGQIAGAAIERIEHLGDRPWFIAAGFFKPHDPFVAPRHYFELYPLDAIPVLTEPADMSPAPNMAVGFGDLGEAFREFTDTERREHLRAYYACVSYMDVQVGRLLEVLDRQNLWDRTIVVFLGDNGYHLGERQWWNKNTLYEPSCRVPLVVAAPGIAQGVAPGIVELIDLYPTLTELCQLPAPHALAGSSFRPLLEDPWSTGQTLCTHDCVARAAKPRRQPADQTLAIRRMDRWLTRTVRP